MDRREHLDWCKARALEYLDDGDIAGALASFGSDILKHEDTLPLSAMMVLGFAHTSDVHAMRRFIEGFN